MYEDSEIKLAIEEAFDSVVGTSCIDVLVRINRGEPLETNGAWREVYSASSKVFAELVLAIARNGSLLALANSGEWEEWQTEATSFLKMYDPGTYKTLELE